MQDKPIPESIGLMQKIFDMSLGEMLIWSLQIVLIMFLITFMTRSLVNDTKLDEKMVTCVNENMGKYPFKEVKEMCEWKVRGQ